MRRLETGTSAVPLQKQCRRGGVIDAVFSALRDLVDGLRGLLVNAVAIPVYFRILGQCGTKPIICWCCG